MTTITAQQFFGGKVPPPPAQTVIHGVSPTKQAADAAEQNAQQQNSLAGIAKNTAVAAGKSLVSDVIDTGHILGESAAAGDVAKNVTAGNVGLKDTAIKVLRQIANDKAAGKDTSRLEQAYNGIAAHTQENDITNILPTLNKSNLDAVLDAVGIGLDVLSAGSLKPAGAIVKAGTDAVSEAGKGAADATGSFLKSAGEKATGLGVGMEVPTRQAVQTYQASQPTLMERVKNIVTGTKPSLAGIPPTTEANTAVRLLQPGTEWQLGVHAKRVANELWQNTITPALRASENANNMQQFLGTIKDRIVKETPDLDRRKVLLKAWQSFADDYKNVRTFSDMKLQQYKEGWAAFVPEKTYKGEPIAAASKEVRALAADEARSRLYNILPDGAAKQAYIDYGNLKSIQEAGIKSIDSLRSKGVTRQVWEAIMDKAVTPIATTAGKVLYKIGSGLEFSGEPGAKTVRDIIQPR